MLHPITHPKSPPTTRLKPLLLAGGQSSRMGTRKELLCLHIDEPLYIQLLSMLHDACPEAETIYLSLRDRDAAPELRNNSKISKLSGDVMTLDNDDSSLIVRLMYDYDEEQESSKDDIGPAAGLLAAHRQDPTANWLVVACDYPLLTADALLQLRQEFQSSGTITCFRNEDGFCESLLGIWTPHALGTLESNVRRGILGPNRVVKELNGKMISPQEEQWLFNANTPEDWQRALEIKKGEATHGKRCHTVVDDLGLISLG